MEPFTEQDSEQRHCLLRYQGGCIVYHYCPKYICVHKTMVSLLGLNI